MERGHKFKMATMSIVLRMQRNPIFTPRTTRLSWCTIKDLKENDIITIRIFVGIGKGAKMRVDGALIDLRVELVEEDVVTVAIVTQLPKGFPLGNGDSIEVFADEILYRND